MQEYSGVLFDLLYSIHFSLHCQLCKHC